jgi:hypothetical protein
MNAFYKKREPAKRRVKKAQFKGSQAFNHNLQKYFRFHFKAFSLKVNKL